MKNALTRSGWALQSTQNPNKFAHVDNSSEYGSGGYPSPTMNIQDIKIWDTDAEAERYRGNDTMYRVVEIRLSLEVLDV